MVHDLSRKMKKSLKKQILENSFKQQIHQKIRITSTNGKTDTMEGDILKNEVVLESSWISDAFDLREPE